MKKVRDMYNWDKFKRMQCNLEKAILNVSLTKLLLQNYHQLCNELVKGGDDMDIFNDTYLKLTYKYNPDKDFKEQFRWLFNQLKGAYFRDDKCNRFYTLEEDKITIPDFIKDEEAITDKDADLITKLKAVCHIS